MRTVADGNITQALIDTQADVNKTPYINLVINSTDYSDRILYIEHHEEPYRERATIGLSNRDGALSGVDLTGSEFGIGYGYDSSGHSGSVTDHVYTATLWVRSVAIIYQGGEQIYQIYAEGMWGKLRDEKVLPGAVTWKASTAYIEDQYICPATANGHLYKCTTAGTSGASEPSWAIDSDTSDGTVVWEDAGPTNPFSNVFDGTHTVEQIMQLVVESLGLTWTPVSDSDGLIDVFQPVFGIGNSGYEPGATILYRLVWMTKSYLRARASRTIQPVFRAAGTDPDFTYSSFAEPKYTEYDNQVKLLIPNSIVVLCNQDPSGEWNTTDYPIIIGTASDATEISKYTEVIQPYIDGTIDNQLDADNRADAILDRLDKESLGGRIILPFHECQAELYDIAGVSKFVRGTASVLNTGTSGGYGQMIPTENGTVYDVYTTGNDVRWRKSTDYGETWTSPVTIVNYGKGVRWIGGWYNRWTYGYENGAPFLYYSYVVVGTSTFDKGDLYFMKIDLSDDSITIVGAYYNFLYFSYGVGSTNIVMLPNGNLFIYAACQSNDSIGVYSTNGGSSWSSLGYISTGSYAGCAVPLMNTNNYYCMVYLHHNGSYYAADLYKYSGGWSKISELASTTDSGQRIHVATDSSGNSYVCLHDGSTTMRIFKIDASLSITELTQITGVPGPYNTMGAGPFFVDGEIGIIHLSYIDTSQQIRYYISNDNGVTWELEYYADDGAPSAVYNHPIPRFPTPAYYHFACSSFGNADGYIIYPFGIPTIADNFISTISHYYDRKQRIYNTELVVGGVTSDLGMPEWTTRPTPSVTDETDLSAEIAEAKKWLNEQKDTVTFPTNPTILGGGPSGVLRASISGEFGSDKNSLWETLTPWREGAGQTASSYFYSPFQALGDTSKWIGDKILDPITPWGDSSKKLDKALEQQKHIVAKAAPILQESLGLTVTEFGALIDQGMSPAEIIQKFGKTQ